MKCFGCTFALVLCIAGLTHAQSTKTTEVFLRHQISLSYGSPSAMGLVTNLFVWFGTAFLTAPDENLKNFYTGSVTAGYTYNFKNNRAAGVTLSYERFGHNLKNASGTIKDYFATNMITIMAKYRKTFNVKKIQFYNRIYAGISMVLPDRNHIEENKPVFLPAVHVTALGFQTTGKVRFFAEIGFGFLDLVSAGISFAF